MIDQPGTVGAERNAGVAAPAVAAWMHEFTDPHTGARSREVRLNRPKDYELQPGDTVRPLAFADGVALPAVDQPGTVEQEAADVEVQQALEKLETALRFQRHNITVTGDESVEYMLALMTLRRFAAAHPGTDTNRRPSPAAGWQPIETAPKDGTTVLVWFKPHGAMSVLWTDSDGDSKSEHAHWHIDDHKHGPFPVRRYMTSDATHWMPLPGEPE